MRRSHAIIRRSTKVIVVRFTTLALSIFVAAIALGAVFLSPFALTWISEDHRIDWSRLSDVGQTYGVTSAILAALALGGVVASLVLQHRESKSAREQALRGLHTDLLKMSLDDQTLLECWGLIGESTDMTWHRQHIYLNLIVSHWQMMWEMGVISEKHLRITAQGVFGGPLGLRFWSEARDMRLVAEKGRRARTFHAIVDHEYTLALARKEITTEQARLEPKISGSEHADARVSGISVTDDPTGQLADRLANRMTWFGLGAVVAWAFGRSSPRRRG